MFEDEDTHDQSSYILFNKLIDCEPTGSQHPPLKGGKVSP